MPGSSGSPRASSLAAITVIRTSYSDRLGRNAIQATRALASLMCSARAAHARAPSTQLLPARRNAIPDTRRAGLLTSTTEKVPTLSPIASLLSSRHVMVISVYTHTLQPIDNLKQEPGGHHAKQYSNNLVCPFQSNTIGAERPLLFHIQHYDEKSDVQIGHDG